MRNYHIFLQQIKEICEEENLNRRDIQGDEFAIQISNDEKSFVVINGNLSLNTGNAGRTPTDKMVTAEMLIKNGFNTIPHKLFWKLKNVDSKETIHETSKEFLKTCNIPFPIVIKPVNGSEGKSVYKLNSIEDWDDIFEIYFESRKNFFNFVVNPFINSEFEYRTIVIDGNLELIYRKNKQTSWKHNLSEGAIPSFEIPEDLKRAMSNTAVAVSKALGLRYGGVDFLVDENGNPIIIEVNSKASLAIFAGFSDETYSRVKEIYRKIILKLLG
jgi:glutathione synthase/RimK-type ligase-like ATP-grasp enzyme